MHFAFSTVACPTWDFDTIVARAREYGYNGVEIRGFLNESPLTAADIFADPAGAARKFSGSGVKICCLASSIAFTSNHKRDAVRGEELRRYIDVAAQIGCPLVKVFDTQVKPPRLFRTETRESAALALGRWLVPHADYAADRNVSIVVENALSFRSAKEMWMIMESIQHPSVGVCWDVFNAALMGEHPSVSVPVLNSRIQYVQVKDATLSPLGANYTKLGEGDIAVQRLMTRLLGIGYAGWVTFEWEKAWLPGLAEPQDVLPDAIKKLRQWTEPPAEEAEPAAKHAPAKKV